MWRRSRTTEESWTCDVTVGNKSTSTTVTQRCSALVNMRPRVILARCTKRSQLESTWDLCRAQGAQGLGYVCELVRNIADDPMTKNIQNSTVCNDTIIRESLSGPPISVISNVDNIRRRLQRAVKETGLPNSQDIDRVAEDSLDEEGAEMVADDVKKGSIPIRLVNHAKSEEQKHIETMKAFEVVDREEASVSKVIGTDGSSRTRERQRNHIFGLDGLDRNSNGWMAPTESITFQLLDWN